MSDGLGRAVPGCASLGLSPSPASCWSRSGGL